MGFIRIFATFTLLGACAAQEPAARTLNCGGKERPFDYDGEAAMEHCKDKTTAACRAFCGYKHAGFLNKENQLNMPKFIKMGEGFPKSMRSGFAVEGLKCILMGSTMSKPSADCSNFRPLLKCIKDTVGKFCDISNFKLFQTV